MTNIVGGNTGNLSQPGPGKENSVPGFAKNATGLDFFELISFATKNHEYSDFNGEGNSLAIEKPGDIDLEKLQSMINVASNFKDIGKLTPKHNTSLALSAVLDKSGEITSANDLNLTSARLIEYMSALQTIQTDNIEGSKLKLIDGIINELENYIFLNKNKSLDQSLKSNLEVVFETDNASQPFERDTNSVATLTFLQNAKSNDHTKEKRIGEAKSSMGEAIKLISFDELKKGYINFDLEKIKKDVSYEIDLENITKIYLNSDNLDDPDTAKTGNVVELDIKFSLEKMDVKLSTIDVEKSFVEKHSVEIPKVLVGAEPDKGKVALDIEVPNERLSALFLNIDTTSFVNDDNATDLKQVFISLKDGQQNAVTSSFPNLNNWVSHSFVSNLDSATIQGSVASNNDQKDSTLDLKSSNNLHVNHSISEDNLILNIKPNIESNTAKLFQENLLSLEEKDLPPVEFLNNLKEKIKIANDFLVRELAIKNDIVKFLEKSAGSLSIQKAVSSYFEKEVGLKSIFSKKNELFMSTADVLSFRLNKNMSTSKSELNKIEFNELTFSDFDDQLITKVTDISRKVSNEAEVKLMSDQFNKIISTQSDPGHIRAEPTNVKPQSVMQSVNTNKFSVLEAQFASRMASAVLEQAVNSKESFDLILEPESFGKVRVNVSLESLQLEVKLSAENTATLAILRASEAVLQSITELNGLKLAEYSVELSNNAQNNSGSKEQKENSGQNDRKTNDQLEKNDDKLEPFIDEGSHSLNLIA